MNGAVTLPTTMASWYMMPKLPRSRGGEVSEMYMGEATEHRPTPTPPTIRNTLKVTISLGIAVNSALMPSKAQAIIMVLLRPSASHIHAPRKGPAMQPRAALPVANPKAAGER